MKKNAVLLAILIFWPSAGTRAAILDYTVTDAVNWRAGRAVPANVSETYVYDEASDTLTTTVVFNAAGFAALPPMMALAVKHGFPARFDAAPEDTGAVTPLGPLMGFSNTDRYTYRIQGLGRYVLDRPVGGAGGAPASLVNELSAQAAAVAQAGHLAPWLYLSHVPTDDNRGNVLWRNPGEVLYLLADILDALPAGSQGPLRSLIQTERQSTPAESQSNMSFTNGAPRDEFPPAGAVMSRWSAENLKYDTAGPPRLWNLYGLARAYEATGAPLPSSVMAACNALVTNQLVHRDWATLYWRRGQTPHFNAVHGANQVFAGLVGYIRLARLAGDRQAEELGWGLLGRAALLRYAMGKYAQFQHANRMFNRQTYQGYDTVGSGELTRAAAHPVRVESDPSLYTLPADPAWWAKQHQGLWIGDLLLWKWTTPSDDIRQVERLDETGVDVWEWGGTDEFRDSTGQKRDEPLSPGTYWYKRLDAHYLPFQDMVPELGRFMEDHLKAETAAYCERVAENQPHWYATYADAILSAEINFAVPADSYGLVKARAWVLKENGAALERYVDVPWVKTGDLFYMHKLAETIKAHRGVTWRRTDLLPDPVSPAPPRQLRRR